MPKIKSSIVFIIYNILHPQHHQKAGTTGQSSRGKFHTSHLFEGLRIHLFMKSSKDENDRVQVCFEVDGSLIVDARPEACPRSVGSWETSRSPAPSSRTAAPSTPSSGSCCPRRLSESDLIIIDIRIPRLSKSDNCLFF